MQVAWKGVVHRHYVIPTTRLVWPTLTTTMSVAHIWVHGLCVRGAIKKSLEQWTNNMGPTIAKNVPLFSLDEED